MVVHAIPASGASKTGQLQHQDGRARGRFGARSPLREKTESYASGCTTPANFNRSVMANAPGPAAEGSDGTHWLSCAR
jgi:hypothetical protein